MFFPAGQLQRLFTQRLTAFRRALAESVGDGRDWPALWKGAGQMLLTRWTRVDTCGHMWTFAQFVNSENLTLYNLFTTPYNHALFIIHGSFLMRHCCKCMTSILAYC